jgi:hypothetical protein
MAVGLGGDMAANRLKSPNNSVNSNLIPGTQLESYQVGKYEVRISDGFFKGKPCFILAACGNRI